jgi:hypothetical protein
LTQVDGRLGRFGKGSIFMNAPGKVFTHLLFILTLMFAASCGGNARSNNPFRAAPNSVSSQNRYAQFRQMSALSRHRRGQTLSDFSAQNSLMLTALQSRFKANKDQEKLAATIAIAGGATTLGVGMVGAIATAIEAKKAQKAEAAAYEQGFAAQVELARIEADRQTTIAALYSGAYTSGRSGSAQGSTARNPRGGDRSAGGGSAASGSGGRSCVGPTCVGDASRESDVSLGATESAERGNLNETDLEELCQRCSSTNNSSACGCDRVGEFALTIGSICEGRKVVDQRRIYSEGKELVKKAEEEEEAAYILNDDTTNEFSLKIIEASKLYFQAAEKFKQAGDDYRMKEGEKSAKSLIIDNFSHSLEIYYNGDGTKKRFEAGRILLYLKAFKEIGVTDLSIYYTYTSSESSENLTTDALIARFEEELSTVPPSS